MSGSVGTMRAGSRKQAGTKDKMAKSERNTTSQQQQSQPLVKTEQQSNKMQPTQEQMRMAQLMTTNQSVADESTVKELMELTGKSENAVVIALHDAENDADRAAMILMEGGDEPQGEWREQGGKRKKKVNTSQKDASDQIGEETTEGRSRDKGEREENQERYDMPPRKGKRNGGPPPRLARGRGRDRDNKEYNNTDNWERDEKYDRSGGDRGRARGRGGYGIRRIGGSGGGRDRFNNNNDRDGRSYNRVPRFEKMYTPQPLDGPEIDTWTNETAETNTSKDTDWDNWNDTWVNEEDQWTGSLEETKVFTPSQMKAPELELITAEPSGSRGQRVDVGSLFIESAKFPKAPDYSKPGGDAYINHFKQAATESIKNSIGIGSSSRPPQSIGSLDLSMGLSSLTQNSAQVQVGVLSSLPQQGPQSSIAQTMTQLSQISIGSQGSQIGGIGSQPVSQDHSISAQSRIPSVIQQQQQNISVPTSMSNSLQQQQKQQKSKLPPPSKIPASAVEMPGHIHRNPQLDLQFGIDFGSESASSFDLGADDENAIAVENAYSNTNGISSVITNLQSQPDHVNTSNDGSSVVSNIMTTPSTMESQQSNRSSDVFHSSVYTVSHPQNESQSLDREKSMMSGSDPIPYSSELEHKTGTLMSQLSGQTNQNLISGSLPQSKNETSYSSANGYTSSSYQSHQIASSISQAQSYNHTANSHPPQSSFQGQFPASQSAYPSAGQSQFSNPSSMLQYPSSVQAPTYSTQNQFSTGQNQFASSGSSSHSPLQHLNHQSQYSSGAQSNYTPSGQLQFSGYQNSSSFTSYPSPQVHFSTTQTGGTSVSLYPVSTQSGNSFSSQSNSYQPPAAGSYHVRDNQTTAPISTQSNTGVTFASATQSSSLKSATSQTNTNYNSQSFSSPAAPLQPTPLANKLGDSLTKITVKDHPSTLDGHQTSQYDHSGTPVTTVSSSLNLPSATSTSLLSTGTIATSPTSTATSPSRITSVPTTSKAPANLPPGVPLMGQYIMGQSTIPPFYSVQPPLYGYEDVQLLQQRMPLTGSYYDMSAFPTPTGTTLAASRDQQPSIPSVPFSGSYAPFLPLNTGTSADASKMARVDPQSPNSANQPQNAHSAAQQPLYNFHYGYFYPSVFPGGGLQYPMFPIPPVTNAAAHSGTTANTQFQKNYTSHMYAAKGTTASEMTQNAYKSHTQTYDKQGFHGGTPPPFSLPLATATQAGPMVAPTAPYAAAPFLPVMAAHQLHHPIQQEASSSSSRGLNQTVNQAKPGAAKSYGGQYWNN